MAMQNENKYIDDAQRTLKHCFNLLITWVSLFTDVCLWENQTSVEQLATEAFDIVDSNAISVTNSALSHYRHPRALAAVSRRHSNQYDFLQSFFKDSRRNHHHSSQHRSEVLFSRDCIIYPASPDESTLEDYDRLQIWITSHSNQQSLIEISRSLMQRMLQMTDTNNENISLNVYLISAEIFQTSGHTEQSIIYCDRATAIMTKLDQEFSNSVNQSKLEIKKRKLMDIRKNISFQLEFYQRIGLTHSIFNSGEFLYNNHYKKYYYLFSF